MHSSFVHRPIVMSRNGLVASGHHLASLAGIDVLKQGGNAFDSAIAISAVLSVVRPHMAALGGDAFALLYSSRTGMVEALNASGPAPSDASCDLFLEKGLASVPKDGIWAVSVPGLVDCWNEICEKHGTTSLKDLLKTAIGYAREGFPVYPGLSQAIEEQAPKLSRDPSAGNAFFRDGRPLRPGEMLIQRDLARTLEKIASEGPRSFYEGDIARMIVDHSRKLGGLLGEDDLAGYQSIWKSPISTTYRGHAVLEQPPVSQGHILLQELNLVEGFDLATMGHNTADSIHLMVEAKKLAFVDRIQYLGDPDFVRVPIDVLLSKEYAVRRRAQIDLSKALRTMPAGESLDGGGETTYFCVVDKDGNAVSFIQSIFHSFGSGVIVEGTGMLLNNRMYGFSLQSNHPNRLEPGKKTAHTLNTYMVMDDGELFMVGGTPGADDQVQVNLQVIANVLDYRMNVQGAIESPRWSSRPGTTPGEETRPYELWIEDRIPSDIRDLLVEKGHDVKTADGWAFGGVQAILIDRENRTLMGGADPRRDGYAIGC